MRTQTNCPAHKGTFIISLGCLAVLALAAPACDPEAIDNLDDVDERAVLDAELAESELPSAQEASAADPERSMHDGALDDPPLEHPGPCATMYEHIHYGGDHREIYIGDDVSYIGGPWNDKVSSAQVQRGCVLNVYEHADFWGRHKTLAGYVRWVGGDWNDLISSYTCTC